MSIAVLVPTTLGDGINPPPLWAGATFAVTIRQLFSINLNLIGAGPTGPVPTTFGDQVHPADLWGAAVGAVTVNVTTIRYILFGSGAHLLPLYSFDQWRGWTFVTDPASVGVPQLPRSSTFPSAP